MVLTMNEQTPGQAATLGRVLHDALCESAVAEFDMPIESFERWDAMRESQRNRMEAAAQRVIDSATEGSIRACGYTLADIGRFLEAEAAAAPAPELTAYQADIASLTDQRNRVSDTADRLRMQVRHLRDALERCRDAADRSPAAVHAMASQALASSQEAGQ